MLASTTGLWFLAILSTIAKATYMANTHGRTQQHLHLQARRLAKYPAWLHFKRTLSTHGFWSLTYTPTTTSSRRPRSSLPLIVPVTTKAILIMASVTAYFRCLSAARLKAIHEFPGHRHQIPHTPVCTRQQADPDISLISIPPILIFHLQRPRATYAKTLHQHHRGRPSTPTKFHAYTRLQLHARQARHSSLTTHKGTRTT